MKPYLWYSNSTADTGKRLAGILQIKCGSKIPERKNREIICWGAVLPEKTKKITINRLKRLKYLNNIFAIQKNRDKFISLQSLKNVCKVPLSCKARYVKIALKKGILHYPLIGRHKNHQGGSGFYMCLQERDISMCKKSVDYFLQHIPTKEEYRLHIFGNRVVRISKKIGKESSSKWIRSNKKGWEFKDISLKVFKRINKSKEMIRESIKAVKKLKLDFGAVDIILSDKKEVYILEVNTGPSLNRVGRDIYVENIKKRINNK